MREQNLEISGDRLHRASGNTLLTDHTARSGKLQLVSLGVERQGLGGANAGTETTIDTDRFINHDLSAGKRHLNRLGLHPFQCCANFINITEQLQNQLAHLVGGNLGADNVCCNIKVLGESIGDGHLHGPTGEGQRHPFFHNASE